MALNLPKKVATLITVDPVGIWTPLLHSYDSIANSVGKWVNVSAQPAGEQTSGDRLAENFGRWGDRSCACGA